MRLVNTGSGAESGRLTCTGSCNLGLGFRLLGGAAVPRLTGETSEIQDHLGSHFESKVFDPGRCILFALVSLSQDTDRRRAHTEHSGSGQQMQPRMQRLYRQSGPLEGQCLRRRQAQCAMPPGPSPVSGGCDMQGQSGGFDAMLGASRGWRALELGHDHFPAETLKRRKFRLAGKQVLSGFPDEPGDFSYHFVSALLSAVPAQSRRQ